MTSIARTSLDGLTVLRLTADTTCPCGEELVSGERIGYETATATALCLHCTATLARADRLVTTMVAEAHGDVDGAEHAPINPHGEQEALALDLQALRTQCLQVVAERRAATEALELAHRGPVARAFSAIASMATAHRAGARQHRAAASSPGYVSAA